MRSWTDTLSVTGGTIATVPADDGGVRVFRGLPYAAPPVGDRRWRAPAPVVPWDGVRPTDRFGPNCPQPRIAASIDPSIEGMSEDCLTLNVWTAAASPGERRPVLVWLHGGAFLVGKASMPRPDGAEFVERGIVLVSMTYRLGAFGFLSHPGLTAEAGASGNYGLMDQIAALAWVRDNIAAFGGDPTRVTIMGHSAGGTSANILILSPLAKGLFHGIIALGGSAMPATGVNDGSPLPRAVEEAKGMRFAAALGVETVAELRALSADRVLAGSGATIGEWTWNASIDGHVLPAAPSAMLAAGQQHEVPLIVGWGADEGSIMARDSFGGEERPFAATIDARFGEAAPRIHALYPSASEHADRAAKAAFAGDGFIVYPTWSWALAQARQGHAPVFVGQFAYAPHLSAEWSSVVPLLGPAGAFHGAQTPYIMGWLDRQATWIVGAADRQISAALIPLYANFIASGDPNGPGVPAWPRYRPDAPEKLRVEPDGAVHSVRDADYERLTELGNALAAAPRGALRYRGSDAHDD